MTLCYGNEGEVKAYAAGPSQPTEAELLEHLGAMARFFLEQGDEAQILADKLSQTTVGDEVDSR